MWVFLLSAEAQQDTVHLDEVVVSRTTMAHSWAERGASFREVADTLFLREPAWTVADVLAVEPGVDIRQRGPQGAQADISLRGGTGDQTLILIDGFNVTDPQTGHHALALPLPLEAVSRIEVQRGPSARILGPGAFAGAVNLVSRLPENDILSASVAGGSYGTWQGSLTAGLGRETFRGLLAVQYHSTAGYRDNTDMNLGRAFFRGRYGKGPLRLDMLAGWLDKAFGANGFYSPAFPGQYEHYRSGLGALRLSLNRRHLYLSQDVSWRRGKDMFLLFRHDPPAWYRGANHHRSDAVEATTRLTLPEKNGYTLITGQYRLEHILSDLLGEPLARPRPIPGEDSLYYDRGATRNLFSVRLSQRFFFNKWDLSGGVLLNMTGEYGMQPYAGLSAAFSPSPLWHLYVSVDQTMRYPTFTELYYKSPVNAGNPSLRPEKALIASGGVSYGGKIWQVQGSLYCRNGHDLIDWVREADSLRWQAMNHASIIAAGGEIALAWKNRTVNGWLERISLTWAWNSASRTDSELLSKYVLDYLRHQLVVSLFHRLPLHGEMQWNFTFRDRAGHYQEFPSGEIKEYAPFLLTRFRVRYPFRTLAFFIDVNNLFNVKYQDIGNLPAPGIWIMGGVKMTLPPQPAKKN